MKKTMLITGGLGFIGSHLFEAVKNDYTITILDNMSNNKTSLIPYSSCNLTIGDIRTFKTDLYFDYVIHLAAIATISNEFDPLLYSVNCAGFENIYRNVKCGNFIYASSAAAIFKKNEYGKTKAHNEYIANDGLGFRFFNVYGERDNGVVRKLLKHRAVIYGGDQTRDFIYIKDVIDCIISNIDKKGILAVGTGVETSIIQLSVLIDSKKDYTLLPENEFEEKRSVCRKPIQYKYSLLEGLKDMGIVEN